MEDVRFAFLLGMAFTFVACPALAKDTWSEVRSDHFTVVGNARVSTLREVGGNLERARSVFVAALGASDPPVPVVVFVVRREADLRELAPSLWSGGAAPAGFFQDTGMRLQIGIRLDAQDPGAAVFHEYHHLLASLGDPNLPMWLREGLAGLWGEARFDGARVEVGRLDPREIRALASRIPLDVTALVRAPGASHSGALYAQAKLFTHMLRFAPEDGASRFDALLDRIRDGTASERALVDLYGPLETLQRDFRAYLQRDAYAFQRIALSRDPAAGTTWVVRTLADAEALARRGEALRLAGGANADAASRVLFDAALRQDPAEPRALSNLATMSPREEALRLVRRLEQRNDGGWEAHWLAARVLTQSSASDAAISAHLAAVTARAPGFAPGWVQLATLRARTDPDAASEMLDRAIALDASRPELIVRLARLLDRAGHPKEALAIATEASRRAIAMPDVWAARRVCRESAASGFGAAALPACDAAIEREPGDWRSHDARARARIDAGDPAGALADLREARRGAARSDSSRASLAARDEWIRELEAGRNPFGEAGLEVADEWTK